MFVALRGNVASFHGKVAVAPRPWVWAARASGIPGKGSDEGCRTPLGARVLCFIGTASRAWRRLSAPHPGPFLQWRRAESPPAVSFLAASPPLRCGCLLPNFGGSTSSPREPWRGWLRAGGGEGGWRLPQLGERAEGGMAPRGRGRPRGVRGEPAAAGPLLPSGCTCPPGRGCWGARGPHPAAGRCATSFRFKLI